MNYTELLSKRRPAEVDMPAGLQAEAKYIFSVTNTVPEFIDVEKYSSAVGDVMRREGKDLAGYPPPLGHEKLREFIAEDLRINRGIDTDTESIILSDGAGGFIKIFLDAFIDPGDVVLLEEFSYLGTLRMFLEKGAQVVHIPTDSNGMDTKALEETVVGLRERGIKPKMIYTISVYQNPTGVTLSLERRKHMVKISQEYDIPIFENESYADFRIDGDPLPPAMMGLDDHESVTYVSSYTKLLGCGLRLGYGVAHTPVREVLEARRPSNLAGMFVNEYLRNYKETHVKEVSEGLKIRRDALLTALEENFPSSCTWTKPAGGMMLWAKLPDGADTWSALDKAVTENVKYNPGGVFRADRGYNNFLRLTYSHNTPAEIHEGISILAEVFRREGFFE